MADAETPYGQQRAMLPPLRCLLSALLLSLALAGCGGGVVFFSTNLGVVDSNASCDQDGGEFPLRRQQGLTVLIILDSDTTIIRANGSAGSCQDLTAGTRASVRGKDQQGTIQASEVRILED